MERALCRGKLSLQQKEVARPSEPRREETLHPREPRPEPVSVPRVEKPFAKAFQALEKSTTSEKLPLAALTQTKPERGVTPPLKGKGPSESNLNTLKSALAGVLKEHEEKKEAPRPEQADPEPVPQPRQNFPEKNLSEQAKVLEPIQEPTPTPKPPEPEFPKGPREVPEDVLSAILRGED